MRIDEESMLRRTYSGRRASLSDKRVAASKAYKTQVSAFIKPTGKKRDKTTSVLMSLYR